MRLTQLTAGNLDAPSYPAPLVQLRPVATHTPAAEDDGSLRECPICFDEITHNKEWLLLPCKHGVCTTCYHKLVQDQHRVTTCPLCRMPLLEPVPTPQPAEGAAPHPETCSRACPWSSQHMLSSTQTASWLNTALPTGRPSTAPQFVHFQHALSPNAVVLPV